MYAFSSSRKTAAQTRPCANCGAPIACSGRLGREADTLCPKSARRPADPPRRRARAGDQPGRPPDRLDQVAA